MATDQPLMAGQEDMNWVHEHMKDLRAYEGQWIAVVNKRVVAAGSSVMELLDEVGAQGLDNPFVTQVPDDVDRKTYFIG